MSIKDNLRITDTYSGLLNKNPGALYVQIDSPPEMRCAYHYQWTYTMYVGTNVSMLYVRVS